MSQAEVVLPPREDLLPPRLVRPRREAIQMIANHIKVGQAIASQRLVYVDDLQQARREKQEWVTRTAELMQDVFGEESKVIDKMNDWVGPILPEYAQVDLFIDQFTNEMKHRIGRLQLLARRLSEQPDGTTGTSETIQPVKVEVEMVAPLVDGQTKAAATCTGLLVLRTADDAARQAIAGFLAALDLSLHVVDQRAGERRPLSDSLEPFDCEAFAVVVSDGSSGDGVDLFDLGCCVGRFGARRVCVLLRDGNATGGNTFGVRHIGVDPGGGWQLHLARQLKAGGAAIDLNRLV